MPDLTTFVLLTGVALAAGGIYILDRNAKAEQLQHFESEMAQINLAGSNFQPPGGDRPMTKQEAAWNDLAISSPKLASIFSKFRPIVNTPLAQSDNSFKAQPESIFAKMKFSTGKTFLGI